VRLALLLLILIAPVADAGVLVLGQPAVELDTAVDTAGKSFKLASYRGRWVVITIGASWCGPCKEELTSWDRMAGEFVGRATFIALDIDDDIADGKKFHQELGLSRMVRVYMPEDRSQVAGTYAVKMPTTVIIGPDGNVRHIQPSSSCCLP
jgi:thiol-disulfide isomerase/thioredoxin